jgi:hypothetical protein
VKKSAFVLMTAAITCMAGSLVALAQPSGLRLEKSSEGFILRDTDSNGLRLRLTSLPTAVSPKATDDTVASIVPGHQTLRADWSVLGPGLHTSLGLSWDNGRQINLTSKTLATTPTTFMGFGWDSLPSRSSRWSLSAEVGTNLSGSYGCFGTIIQSCTKTHPLGLSGDAVGSGLRLNPYISFGATYSFDR